MVDKLCISVQKIKNQLIREIFGQKRADKLDFRQNTLRYFLKYKAICYICSPKKSNNAKDEDKFRSQEALQGNRIRQD
ncbi:MAG: hypothetical protein JWO03_2416 [Bacteroidetes bacterium]|nr:hypothetical protein [Bacteroidota bacterium]